MSHNSCKGCIDRTVGCHASCEKYLAFKKELDKIKKAKNDERILNKRFSNKYFANGCTCRNY